MDKRLFFSLAVVLSFMLSSCEIVGGIFKAGMYWAFFLVALVIGVILYFVFKSKK